jgi:hypothetical protein
MAGDAKCGYLPPDGALPEMRPTPKTAGVAWTPEAQALLERIPGFVRARVRERLEAAATREALPAITPEFMHAHRPQGAFLAAAPGSPSRMAAPRPCGTYSEVPCRRPA